MRSCSGSEAHPTPSSTVAAPYDRAIAIGATKTPRLVRWSGMAALPIEQTGLLDSIDGFTRFYRANLPVVFGYALRLCGGDRAQAEDLTQDAWFALARELRRDRTECADVRWLLTVTRSRFIDGARRDRLAAMKLTLLRTDHEVDDEPTRSDVLELLAGVQPLHRVVLLMRYCDDMSVPTIAAEIGRQIPATNSLLARARADLRRQRSGASS